MKKILFLVTIIISVSIIVSSCTKQTALENIEPSTSAVHIEEDTEKELDKDVEIVEEEKHQDKQETEVQKVDTAVPEDSGALSDEVKNSEPNDNQNDNQNDDQDSNQSNDVIETDIADDINIDNDEDSIEMHAIPDEPTPVDESPSPTPVAMAAPMSMPIALALEDTPEEEDNDIPSQSSVVIDILMAVGASKNLDSLFPNKYKEWNIKNNSAISLQNSTLTASAEGSASLTAVDKQTGTTVYFNVLSATKTSIMQNGKLLSFGQTAADVVSLLGSPTELIKKSAYVESQYRQYFPDLKYNIEIQEYVYAGNADRLLVVICIDGSTAGFYLLNKTDFIQGANSERVKYNDTVGTFGNYANLLIRNDIKEYFLLAAPAFSDYKGDAKIFYYINNVMRSLSNVGVMQFSDAGSAVASGHSTEMAQLDYVDHASADGSTTASRLKAGGVYYTSFAENISTGHNSAYPTFDALFNSQSHRENLLREGYQYMGAAYGRSETSKAKIYFTQVMFSGFVMK